MSEVQPGAADRRQAARHMQIVTGLVLEHALTVDGNRAFGEPMERIAAWREARARVLGTTPGTVADLSAAGGLSPSALLRELVEGMRAAAESHPEVARVLSLSRSWPANVAVTDEVRARRREARERWARGASASPSIAPPAAGRPGTKRRP
jgi:hypothetical protein